jgi:peroxiredoxin
MRWFGRISQLDLEKAQSELKALRLLAEPEDKWMQRSLTEITEANEILNRRETVSRAEFQRIAENLESAEIGRIGIARLARKWGQREIAFEYLQEAIDSKSQEIVFGLEIPARLERLHLLNPNLEKNATSRDREALEKICGSCELDHASFDILQKNHGETTSSFEVDAFMPPMSLPYSKETLGPLSLENPSLSSELLGLIRPNGASIKAKAQLLVLHLGELCPGCVGQIQSLADLAPGFKEAGIILTTVSEESSDRLSSFQADLEFVREAPAEMEFISDPELKLFRALGAYDEFEEMPLHGIYLISAEGKLLWHDVRASALLEVSDLLDELVRHVR